MLPVRRARKPDPKEESIINCHMLRCSLALLNPILFPFRDRPGACRHALAGKTAAYCSCLPA